MRIPANEKNANKKENNKATDSKATPSIKDSGIKHTVKSGDRLDKIAKKYDVKVDDIVALNQLKRQELTIGQVLRIPDNGKSAVKSDDKSKAQTDGKENIKSTSTVKESGTIHTVKSGDRLDKIAQKYGVSENDIMALNNLKRNTLRIGDKLKIPAKLKTEKAEKIQEAKSEKEKKADKTLETKSQKEKQTTDKPSNKETLNTKSDKTEKPKTVPKYHVMEKDQTIYAVGRLYNISPDKILKLNPKLKNGKVAVGQKIQLKE